MFSSIFLSSSSLEPFIIKCCEKIIVISFNVFYYHDYYYFTYMKMSKGSSAKYYQNDKERLLKQLANDTKDFLKKKKKKKQQYGPEQYKNLPVMKNKGLLSIEKNLIKREKVPYYNYDKIFSFRKSTIILKTNDETIYLFQKADLTH